MKKLSEKNKRAIEDMLTRFYFVRWDRCVPEPSRITFYGWIDRPQDSYKDFISLELEDGEWYFITSSVARHAQIFEILGISEEDTYPCKRIEHHFSVENAIKLKA